MSAIARMAVLDLRTVAPYRNQVLVLFALMVLIDVKSPVVLLPALVLLVTSQIAAYPFLVADKAGPDTLYTVLPLPRRSVLYGHYAWAMASFLVTATMGTALALILAQAEAAPFGGRTLATALTLSWASFAVNVAIQFPLFIRFGYSRISVLGTTLPRSLLLWVAGVVAIVTSTTVAMTVDLRRARHHRPTPTTGPARTSNPM
jgi:ABC-2 family transporter protein